jgi:replicative DNA helicase
MFTPGDRAALAERLVFWPGPPPADLAKTTSLALDMVRKADADTLVVDGLKDVAIELSKDDVGAGLNQAFQRCVAAGIEVVGNHHQRKHANGIAKRPRSLDDLYGSTWIGAGAGTVILMWADQPGQSVVELSTIKPAYESVGPLTILHDLDTGTLDIRDAVAVEDVLRAAAGEPLSLADIAAQIGEPDIDHNGREALRRKLVRLEKIGVVDDLDVPRATGGRPEKRYLWTGP